MVKGWSVVTRATKDVPLALIAMSPSSLTA